MKILFIGGTGNISSVVSKLLLEVGDEVFHLNRGNTGVTVEGSEHLKADINNISVVKKVLNGHVWDVVVNWIAFKPEDVERDIELFRETTNQYFFISSASAYQKPPSSPFITESTPLANPFWQYSRDKIACEEVLLREYRESGFPMTIVRPSHTYNNVIPAAFGGWNEFAIIDRMRKGKEIVVHGDGTSLWVLTHALDFAEGFTGLFGLQQAIGHAFHITSDEVLTWNQIYQAIGEAAGYEPNIVHIPTNFIVKTQPDLLGNLWGDKAHSVIFDNSKIKRFVPNYCASIPFSQGIKSTLQWFLESEERMTVNPETDIMFDQILDAYRSGSPV